MIRNVVIHLLNEQPLWADLPSLPGPGDGGILCVNLRMANGSPPPFVSPGTSQVWFPMSQIRFVEIPAGPPADPSGSEPSASDEAVAEVDEGLLRRIREL